MINLPDDLNASDSFEHNLMYPIKLVLTDDVVKESVKVLLDALVAIQEGETDAAVYCDLKTRWQFVLHEETERLANGHLIANNGQVNWANVRILEAHGFKVFALERDSFGWVIGGIKIMGNERLGGVVGILSFG